MELLHIELALHQFRTVFHIDIYCRAKPLGKNLNNKVTSGRDLQPEVNHLD